MSDHLDLAINFANLVKSTLGPLGMNKMIVSDNLLITNDGATIVSSLKGGNPIVELFKALAKSQEEAVGDGTTTALILSGQLLQNARELVSKGIHPTTIIKGYNLARMSAIEFIDSKKEPENKEQIIKTTFGTKISPNLIEHFTKLLMGIKGFKDIRLLKLNNCNPFDSQVFDGYVFEGFTINERMPEYINGKIAILDFPINWKMDKFSVTNAEEMEKVQNLDSNFKKKIVDKLIENEVKCVFYTDTTPEFESYLTEKNIMGIVIFQREHLDWISKALNTMTCSSFEQIGKHLGDSQVMFMKEPNLIYVNGLGKTFVLKAQTTQLLDEYARSLDDVIRVLKHDLKMVVGAGAIEIETSNFLRKVAETVGGKEQIAIEKFAESLESIPLIIAENAGLDAMEILTSLKTLHIKGNKDVGVDVVNGTSDARKRGIFEPALIKTHAINSATDITNLIMKIDSVLQGEK